MPRRSNACETCRRRKVKCDESKPTCDRCSRQGYECQGYCRTLLTERTGTAFRDQTQRVAARAEASYAKNSLVAEVPRASPIVRKSPVPREYASLGEDEHPALLLCSEPLISLLPTWEEMEVSRQRRSRMMADFTHLYLPHYSSNIDRSHFAYMYLLPDIIGQHPAIPIAVDALCMHHLGREYDDPEVLAASKILYGNAISRLADNLRKTDRYGPIGTLAAILLLAQCEVHQVDTRNAFAWENHVQGAQMLLKAFDPPAWNTNEGRLLLQCLSYILACQGLFQRKAIIFTKPEWLQLLTDGNGKDQWINLLNIIANIPGQLETHDKLMAMPSDPLRSAHVLNSALQLRSRLIKWYTSMTAETSAVAQVEMASLGWYEPTPFDSEFSCIFRFRDWRSTYLRMQYYSFMLALSISIQQLLRSGLVDLTKDSLPPNYDVESETLSLAINAARCIPTVLDPAIPSVLRLNGAVAIKLAGEYFHASGYYGKASWCQEMDQQLQKHSFDVPVTLQLQLPDGGA